MKWDWNQGPLVKDVTVAPLVPLQWPALHQALVLYRLVDLQ